MKVLVACQGHPRLAPGGAESAAYHLFEALAARPDCSARFLGCGPAPAAERARITQPFGPHDYVYHAQDMHWFHLANRDPLFPAALDRLLRAEAPDVVHLHGLGRLGVEAPMLIRRALPQARIVLTLHEYLPICANHGQMVTRPERRLCAAASPAACVACFPQHSEADFVLRERYIKLFLRHIDAAIAPSAFLRDRYIAWGLDPARLSVLDNVGRAAPAEPLPPVGQAADGVLRVGYFGQLAPTKGLGVLIEAARLLAGQASLRITLHGDSRALPAEMEQESRRLLAAAPANVHQHGRYAAGELDALMAATDVVVVPSIWWENAPMVIDEALARGRPVIASTIGGIAERLRDGIDGVLLPPGDAAALARTLARFAALPHHLSELAGGLRQPTPPAAAAERHLALYRALAG